MRVAYTLYQYCLLHSNFTNLYIVKGVFHVHIFEINFNLLVWTIFRYDKPVAIWIACIKTRIVRRMENHFIFGCSTGETTRTRIKNRLCKKKPILLICFCLKFDFNYIGTYKAIDMHLFQHQFIASKRSDFFTFKLYRDKNILFE